MRTIMYRFTQKLTCFALFCYFREIQLHGMHKVPKDQAVIFLANHQNALLDPLVIAAYTPFRSYFLTRADIFINALLRQIFDFLRMLPIYRIRDGRDTLVKNEEIFEKCTQLLKHGKSILLFPEANHNIMRRVRPFSKGFTRILFATLDKAPELDVLLVPVGINYEDAGGFPDRVAFYFCDPISSRAHYDKNEIPASVTRIKSLVSDAIKGSTTHIDEVDDYTNIQRYLDLLGVDYLKPEETNAAIKEYTGESPKRSLKRRSIGHQAVLIFIQIINAPVLLVWRWLLKPRIEEVEFVSTFRFAYALFVQPLFYLLLWLICFAFFGALWASLVVLIHFLLNLLYVKFGRSIS